MWVRAWGPDPSARMTQRLVPVGRQQLVLKAMWVPSGDQSGKTASRFGAVRRFIPVPFGFITQTADSKPPRLESKTILEPSGEYSGSPSTQCPLVSGVMPVPSAFITEMWQSWNPSGTGVHRLNTILVPFGDQRGWKFWKLGLLVSCVLPLPSAFITQISKPPVTSLW